MLVKKRKETVQRNKYLKPAKKSEIAEYFFHGPFFPLHPLKSAFHPTSYVKDKAWLENKILNIILFAKLNLRMHPKVLIVKQIRFIHELIESQERPCAMDVIS